MKGIKIHILTTNEFKKGLSSFFIVLKKLYRKKQTKLEVIYLNKCYLDDSSFFELGELLKFKYCSLKKLYINNDILPYNIHFLKKIKRNKSLTDLSLYKNNIDNSKVNDILRIINNTGIRNFNLFKNEITNISDYLRIINEKKIIKDYNDVDYNINTESYSRSIKFFRNKFHIINKNYISLFSKILKENSLHYDGIICILFSLNSDRIKIKKMI